MGGDWGARLPHTKSKQQQINLEKHVSCISEKKCLVYFSYFHPYQLFSFLFLHRFTDI